MNEPTAVPKARRGGEDLYARVAWLSDEARQAEADIHKLIAALRIHRERARPWGVR